MANDWWRSAVVYQIYPRSFADADGDGTGDVRGMIERLPEVARLGVDAVWVSPWYPSPLADGGYDVSDYRGIHPDFGTLADADEFIAKAHDLDLRVIIDLVPNHSSDQHAWFRAALAAGPGSPERGRYVFRDGRGDLGDEAPTNWGSLFGGPAWDRVVGPDGPEQWFLHMFASEQPDWDWTNPEVAQEFDAVLRFWFDRGVDGFRVDVADSLAIDPLMADVPVDPHSGYGTIDKFVGHPLWDQPELMDIHARWRRVADEYADSPAGARIFVSEAYLGPAPRLAKYVGPGQLHTTFNFDALTCEWNAVSQRNTITATLAAHEAVGAPATWVLGNHDVIRVASRYGKPLTGQPYDEQGPLGESWGNVQQMMQSLPTDLVLGRRRARAAVLLELALPGGAYIYQGEELGLEEVEDLPDAVLQDPTFLRTGGANRGRDGCRVPIPWTAARPSLGFGPAGTPWLPQPASWAELSRDRQEADPGSFLHLYRAALAERKANPALGAGHLTWVDTGRNDILCFRREPGFTCVVNFGTQPYELPAGVVLLTSLALEEDALPGDATAWLGV